MPFARLQDDGRAARETTPQQPQHYRYTDSRATMWAGDSFVVLMSASSLHVGRHLNYRTVTVLKGRFNVAATAGQLHVRGRFCVISEYPPTTPWDKWEVMPIAATKTVQLGS